MSRKKIFFTADLHIGHENSLKFDNRPFKDLDHMHRVFINNHNAIVPEDGITYFLGDIGMCNVDTMRSVLDKLNGTKILLLGNHDGGVNRMYNLGFDCVINTASMVIAGELVTLSHCPLKRVFREDTTGMRNEENGEQWHGVFRHPNLSVRNEGQFHLHGHIHSPNDGKSTKIKGRQYDVGVVANGYRPVSISTIESWISKNKVK